MNSPHPPPAGWYPDPAGRAPFRYWDGTRWTEHTQQGTAPTPGAPGVPGAPGPAAAHPAAPPVWSAGGPAAPASPGVPPGYGAAGPYAPQGAVAARPAAGPSGALNAQSFVEELKRFEGWAVVVAGFLLLMICSFLPWTGAEATTAQGKESDSSNAWTSDAPWLIRGYEVTEDNVVTAANGGDVGSGSDMVLILPLAIAAAGVAIAVRVGKRFNRSAEVGLGLAAVLAVLMIAEAVHMNGAAGDLEDIFDTYGIPSDFGLEFGFYLAVLASLVMAVGAFRTFQASRVNPH